MSRYNRLSRPLGIMGSREAFRRLCDMLKVDPHNTDLVRHIHDFATADAGEICRLVEIDGAEETREYRHVKSIALRNVRNEARATKIDPRIET